MSWWYVALYTLVLGAITVAMEIGAPAPPLADRVQTLERKVKICCEAEPFLTNATEREDAEELTLMVELRRRVKALEEEIKRLKESLEDEMFN